MSNSTVTQEDVLRFIRTSMTLEDSKALVAAFNTRIKAMRKAATIALRVGQRVEWTSKYGSVVRGNVTKVGRTRAHVTADGGGRWYVSSSLLRNPTAR